MAHPLEHQDIVLKVIPNCKGERVLDCGCGRGIWGFLIRCIKNGEDAYMIGVDLYLSFLKSLKRFNVYDELILCDVRKLPFRRKAFSIVLASEIIEHLPKHDGYPFICQCKDLAEKALIITTPNTSEIRRHTIKTLGHLSSWDVRDLRKEGFHVRGYGFRFLRYKPKIYSLLDGIFTPIAYVFPRIGGFLVAYLYLKDVKGTG